MSNKEKANATMVEDEKASSASATKIEKPKINKLGMVPVFLDIGKFHYDVSKAFADDLVPQVLQR